MPEQIKIITSRRSYEFGADAVRLSMLSIQQIQQQIQQMFSFQSTGIGAPVATFGTVPSTFPPGLVFDIGVWIHQEESIVPIRFIHFEQNRVVIDVAGPTAAIDGIAERLFHFLSGLQAPDGSPVVGEPHKIYNYSEITAQFSRPLESIFSKPFQKLLNKTFDEDKDLKVVIPTLALQALSKDQIVAAVPGANDPFAFTLALRSGTRPDEHIYFSGAPIDSERHLSYLHELESVFN